MKLSVITTVYNSAKYLEYSLESLLQQNYKDFILYLLDDGSEDSSYSILEKYKNKFSNCLLLRNNKNKGIPFSRNKCLAKINTEYVAIHDSDDFSLKHRFEKQIDYLDNHKETQVLGGFAIKMDMNSNTIGSMVYPPDSIEKCIYVINRFKLNPIIDPSVMYRHKTIIESGGYSNDPELMHVSDFELWCRLISLGYEIKSLPDFVIKYRINTNGVTISNHTKVREMTDIIWAKFKNKNFKKFNFNKFLFQEDSILF
jgi:glycosyltransferase involved in cell wall biosynthesis